MNRGTPWKNLKLWVKSNLLSGPYIVGGGGGGGGGGAEGAVASARKTNFFLYHSL